MLLNHDIAIDKFLDFSSAGLKVASFAEIRQALISKYKEVYGSDIDLSSATVDGVWINNMSLIINNICQVCSTLYSNLDVNTASGIYLDALCRLANIVRKPATKSTATLTLTNTSGTAVTIDNSIDFIDGSGEIWTFYSEDPNITSVTIAANASSMIQVKCATSGAVIAEAGWINICAQYPYVSVEQEENAIVGTNEETDQELRARRYQASGGDGLTTLDNLLTSLFALSYVKDVKIYNGNSAADPAPTAADGTSISLGSIYVIIRMQDGYSALGGGNINPSEIGTLIYNKLTPGIYTVQANASYTVAPVDDFNEQIVSLQETVNWKEASPIHPQIDLALTATNASNFGGTKGDGEEQEIFEALRDWANGLSIGTVITVNDIIGQLLEADPRYQGRKTYDIGLVTIASATNPDTYYNYTEYTYTKTDNNITIVLK